MTNEEVISEHWSFTKQLFALVQVQQTQIDTMYRLHWGLLDAIRDQFGLPPAPVPDVIDPEAIAKMQAGIDELEAMFAPKDDDDKDGEP